MAKQPVRRRRPANTFPANLSVYGISHVGLVPIRNPRGGGSSVSSYTPPTPPTPPAPPVPPVPRYYVELDGATSVINCGSDTSLDDLPLKSSFTADIWARMESSVDHTSQTLFSKFYSVGGQRGWRMALYSYIDNVAIIEVEVYGDINSG